jgi:alkanesulfonate monooxygenase SsuD/methylene tetrahydromethanopterin reductase-like flavin-dependent oxidoreductase (luciferase family)
MRFGVSVPNFGEYADPATLAALARDAEAAGWAGFFLWDHMLFWKGFQQPIADPWVVLAVVAMSTERLRLGPLVTPLARRRPWKVARETVTLDHLSRGRVILGVGLGFPPDAEFSAFGEPADERVRAAMLDEALTILIGLWSGEPFSHAGTHYAVDDVQFLPRPIQTPRIPLWVAGMWPNRPPFRRAARWDGVVPISLNPESGDILSPDEIRELTAYIREHRASSAAFDVVLGGSTPGDDHARASELVKNHERAGVTWWIESLNHWRGPYDEMVTRVRQGPPRL